MFLSIFETGDKVELIVAAGFSGAVFGALFTISIWILQRKVSKDNLWYDSAIFMRCLINLETSTFSANYRKFTLLGFLLRQDEKINGAESYIQ